MTAASGRDAGGTGASGANAALGLLGVLAPVLADVASADAVRGARASAQALGLAGLERLLEVCAPRAGLVWPAELIPALDRVRRLAAQTAETADLAPFREADRELAGLAGEISALRWSPARGVRPGGSAGPGAVGPVATLGLADALEDLPLADDASRELARRARVVPPVAAALRAALEWLAGGSTRPLALRAEDSLLEVRCEHVDFDGLAAAAEVLAAVGANLGPGLAPSDPWLIRVPLQGDRKIHLMIVSGGLPIAIPWHAVLRLHMATAAEVAGRGFLGGWPMVTGLLGGEREPVTGEVLLALVAHGRKRGWIVADRLIWRLPAEPVAPTSPSPADGLTVMVETAEGERYWLADPGWLLRAVEAPALEKPARAPAPVVAPAPAPAPVVAPPPAAAAVTSSPASAPVRETPRLTLLTSADVRPIASPERAPDPVRPPLPASPPAAPADLRGARVTLPDSAPGAAPREAAAPGPRAARTALVAEDSITARIFLARLLSRQGFDVRTVDTAAALRAELERGGWMLTCVDIELPDETGTAFLAGLVARHGAGTAFVALVRDAEDRAAARRAGIERMLRKPFDEREIEMLLGRLGLPAAGAR
jgi:CheY-like chemotaxis protein